MNKYIICKCCKYFSYREFEKVVYIVYVFDLILLYIYLVLNINS